MLSGVVGSIRQAGGEQGVFGFWVCHVLEDGSRAGTWEPCFELDLLHGSAAMRECLHFYIRLAGVVGRCLNFASMFGVPAPVWVSDRVASTGLHCRYGPSIFFACRCRCRSAAA